MDPYNQTEQGSIARNRPRRRISKKTGIYSYGECEICDQISDLNTLLQWELEINGKCDIAKIRQFEHRLEKLKRHNCSGNYIYDSNNEDEDFLTDYNLSSRRSLRAKPIKKSVEKHRNTEEIKETKDVITEEYNTYAKAAKKHFKGSVLGLSAAVERKLVK